MNQYQNAQSGAGLLKNVYSGGGPISQMHDLHPEIHALRKRRDMVGKKQTLKKE